MKPEFKTLLAVLAMVVFAIVLGSLFAPRETQAAEVWKATLDTDGGNAGVTPALAIDPKTTYSLKCTSDACYRVGAVGSTTAPTPNCTQDFPLSSAATVGHEFNAGGALRLVVKSLDGGTPSCRVWTVTSAPN